MKSYSSAYSSKLYLAQELAKLDARAVTISAVARTKPSDSRATYRQVHNTQSDSGQTPKNHAWFLANQSRRLHGAALLMMYAKYRAANAAHPDAHGIAFTLTLRRYKQMCVDGIIVPPERLNLLVGHGFYMTWRNILQGGSSQFPQENLKLLKCRHCRLPHLVEAHYLNYVCQDCSKD